MLKKYYETLGLDKNASYEEVKKSYKEKIEELLGSESVDTKQLRKVQNSFIALSNKYKNISSDIDEIKKGIKNSISDMFIPNTNILKPEEKEKFESQDEYERYLDDISEDVDIKPRKKLPTETDEEYSIYIDEYYNKIMDKINISENKSSKDSININDSYLDRKGKTPEKIEGTEINKPRDRELYETEAEYEKFLENYYENYFPTKAVESKNEKIEGTEINKPRDREPYETNEYYEKFLENYYEKHFLGNENNDKTEIKDNISNKSKKKSLKDLFKKGTKHKIIKKRKNKKHKFLKRLLTIATLGITGIPALLKRRKKNKIKPSTQLKNESKNIEKSLREQLAQSVGKIIDSKDKSKILKKIKGR